MGNRISKLMKSIVSVLSTSFKRFPESLLLSSLTVFILIYMNHLDWQESALRDTLTRLAMVLALGVPITLSTKMYFERSKGLKNSIKGGIYFVVAAFLLLYYLFGLKDREMVDITRYIAVTIASYLIFTIIPYFYQRENYELYVIKLVTRFAIVFLYSVVLFLGLVAILFTIEQLFSVPMPNRLYMDIWLIVVGIFAPAFFLGELPTYNEKLKLNEYPKVFKVLFLYIVTPLLSAYTIILYSYFIKVVITREWPQGLISNLVLWYAVISTIVVFFIKPLVGSNQWGRIFTTILPKGILPLLAMMFISIGIRINAYGITERRYFVLVLGLWVTGCMIYFAFRKKARSIIVTISIALIAIISVVGPLSSYSVSKFSQNQRFSNILVENGLLQDGEIRPVDELPFNAQVEISQILSYFNGNHSLDDVKYLDKNFSFSDMEEVFGFPYHNVNNYNYREYYHYFVNEDDLVFDISDFDYFTILRSYGYDYKQLGSVDGSENSKVSMVYNANTKKLTISRDDQELININLEDLTESIPEKHGAYRGSLKSEELAVVTANENINVRLQFRNLSFIGNKNIDQRDLESFEAYVFIKIK
ncbi:DUF4153 domain-containing protein [Alkaliphilus transvaalensis]|uniref:DUF4153 domain-containing protein n=1 Tax=Alkaliphilus transvaalensis TaxID=114628 RepID=UPI000688C400|nr:DUF4153 domain-containing protein [Alkaliphilus transvaalensis]